MTRRETFDGVESWYEDAKSEVGEMHFVIIGNKIDLEEKREVSTSEGKKKADELRCTFIETSAKENINVQDTFKILGIGWFSKKFQMIKNLFFSYKLM